VFDRDNAFYRQWTPLFYWVFLWLFVVLILFSGVFFWQLSHRKLPSMAAISPKGIRLWLVAHQDPSFTPEVLLQWASKAAVTAYTFDFVNYEKQSALAREWFTRSGWQDYQASLVTLLQTIASRQLFVNSVVSAPPVIALTDASGWSVQLPFLVTYQSSDKMTRKNFLVKMSIVKVPTSINPTGMGVSGFVMTGAH